MLIVLQGAFLIFKVRFWRSQYPLVLSRPSTVFMIEREHSFFAIKCKKFQSRLKSCKLCFVEIQKKDKIHTVVVAESVHVCKLPL